MSLIDFEDVEAHIETLQKWKTNTWVALLNDIHWGVRNDNQTLRQHQIDFYQDQFFPYCEANGIQDVILMGDVFDRRKYVNFSTLELAIEHFFKPAKAKGMRVYAFTGNHDVYWKDTNRVNSLSLLVGPYLDRLLVSEPALLNINGWDLACVPWITRDNHTDCLKFIESHPASILLGHFDINGFEMMPGVMCENGMDPDMFKPYQMVLSGHYHAKSTRGNIHYLGSQYQMDWGDYGQTKAFHVLELSEQGHYLRPVWNENQLFYKLTYDDGCDFDLDSLARRYVKVIVKNKNDAGKYEKFLNTLSKVGVESLQVLEQDLSISSVLHEIDEESGEIIQRGTAQVIQDCIANMQGVNETTRAEVSKLMQDLYAEAHAAQRTI